ISSENTDVPVTEAPATEAPAVETQTVGTTEAPVPDVADLSSVNTGDDAFSNVSDLPDISLNGAIAVIDTGCSGANVKKAVSVLGGSTADDNGHGTAMMDAIVNEYNGASILSIKALDASGRAQVSDIYAAIKYAVDSNVSVISLSMAALRTSETALVEQAVNEALSKGIVVVGAAGNQGSDASSFIPGGMSGVITAGSCDETGTRQAFSNYGSAVDYNIVSSSTSEACAMLAAMIARDGVSGLKVNEGNLFATDYVPETSTGTDGSETEPAVTTETVTTEEAVTETTTEAATTEETATADATASDSGKKKWNIGDLINGLFEMQYDYIRNSVTISKPGTYIACATWVSNYLRDTTNSVINPNKSLVGELENYLLTHNYYQVVDCGDYTKANQVVQANCQDGDVIIFKKSINGDWMHCGVICDKSNAIYRYSNGDKRASKCAIKEWDVQDWLAYSMTDPGKESTYFKILRQNQTGSLRIIKSLENTTTWDKTTDILGAQYGVYPSRTDADNGTNCAGVCVIDGNGPEGIAADNISANANNLRPGTYYVREIKEPSSGAWKRDTNVYEVQIEAGKRTTLGRRSDARTYSGASVPLSGDNFNELTVGPEQPNPFYINVTKAASNPNAVQGNTNYSLNGAQYTLYKDAGCSEVITDINGNPAVFTISAAPGAVSGTSETRTFKPMTGTLYLKETRNADSGYVMSQILTPVDISNGVWGTTKTVNVSEDETKPYTVNITKRTDPSNVSCVLGNPNYSLNGAQYTVYTDQACTQIAQETDTNGNKKNAVITMIANPGETTARPDHMPSFDYAYAKDKIFWVKETKGPDKGYETVSTPKLLSFINVEPGTTISQTFDEPVTLDPFVTSMYKVDAETGEAVADAHGTLTSARYTMRFYAVDVTRTYTAAELKTMTPAREWVFATNPDPDGSGGTVYRFQYNDDYKVSGPDLYKDPSGNAQLPIGYITIEETAAPAGYTTAGAKYNVVYRDGTTGTDDNGVIVARADADGDVYVGNKPVSEKIINLEKSARADIRIVKKDDAGNRLKNCKFRVTNLDTTESHIFFTDENGEFDTSKVDSSLPANAMDTADTYSKAPVWFGIRADGSYADFSDAVSALNYGTYRIEELPCKANKGLQLMHPVTVNVTEALVKEAIAKGEKMVVTLNEGTLDTDAIVDMENPYIKTEALSKKTGDSVLPVSEDETLIDRVHYFFLKADTEYTLHAELMVKHKDGSYEPFTRDDGTAYAEDHPFKTSADYTVSMYEKCGTE
ncbi:hypothetical protein DXC24_15850, partial [Clostridium sp. OM08-29]